MNSKYIVIALLAFSSSSFAETNLKSLENISQELVDIRQQISNLHDKINFKKENFRDQLRSFANQKSDLEVKISRSDLNLKDLQRELNKLKEINQDKYKSYDELTPVIEKSISSLRASIKGSLPFKIKERLQALDDIEHRINSSIISPNKAANQLWAYVEDELMIGRSSGIYNESINIGGEDRLVKVLRIGKIAMLYKTPDEGYGVFRKQENKWVQVAIEGGDNTRQLDYLFDSFNKNIRNGLFTIPNILPNS